MTDGQTVAERLDDYARFEQQCTFVAGAVGVLLVAGGLASNALRGMPILAALFITCALAAGGCAGRARFNLANDIHVNNGRIARGELNLSDIASESRSFADGYARKALNRLKAGFWLLIMTGLLLLTAAWYSVFLADDESCAVVW